MKASDLLNIWEAPDNSRLTPKQVSLRLPVHVAARISALCDMYPKKTKTEIMGDLLTAALDQLQEAFPSVKGKFLTESPDAEGYKLVSLYEEIGPARAFYNLSNHYYIEFEKELGNETPSPIFPTNLVIEE